jgi:hypothetical protein
MRGRIRLADPPDTVLAGAALTFAAIMLVVRWLFEISIWTRAVLFGWELLVWTATALVVAMVALAALQLARADRSASGTLLAVVALVNAPVHVALAFGLVDPETLLLLSRIASWGLYPLLTLLSAVVLLRPLLRRRPPAATLRPGE